MGAVYELNTRPMHGFIVSKCRVHRREPLVCCTAVWCYDNVFSARCLASVVWNSP